MENRNDSKSQAPIQLLANIYRQLERKLISEIIHLIFLESVSILDFAKPVLEK